MNLLILSEVLYRRKKEMRLIKIVVSGFIFSYVLLFEEQTVKKRWYLFCIPSKYSNNIIKLNYFGSISL